MSSEPFIWYFDFISPYAYLAWSQTRALAQEHGTKIRPVPVLFAGLLNHYGQLGPAEVEPKRIWTFKQVLRRAHRLGLPLKAPPAHPFNPLPALRVALAALESDDEEKGLSVVEALYAATWGRGDGVEGLEGCRRALEAGGIPSEELLAAAQSTPIKEGLKTTTASAIELGVFGVPTLSIRGELFWGSEVFEDARDFLAGRDPVQTLPDDFHRLKASASRPRPGR